MNLHATTFGIHIHSQKSSTSLTPKIDHYNRQMALESHSPQYCGGALSRPSKANLSKAKISEEESNAARIAKIRDLRDVLSLLTFDRQFHQIADDCSQALDECEKVLVVSYLMINSYSKANLFRRTED